MHQHIDQDAAWLRVQDAQREAENRRLWAGEHRSALIVAIKRLFGRANLSAKHRRETA
ncbi:MAG TPA: hypothetical protein VNG70_08660 [Candidatus Limnocylindria bacterium]|nr:hypothetical protein [Candidatus Limnocylindria bacterium]